MQVGKSPRIAAHQSNAPNLKPGLLWCDARLCTSNKEIHWLEIKACLMTGARFRNSSKPTTTLKTQIMAQWSDKVPRIKRQANWITNPLERDRTDDRGAVNSEETRERRNDWRIEISCPQTTTTCLSDWSTRRQNKKMNKFLLPQSYCLFVLLNYALSFSFFSFDWLSPLAYFTYLWWAAYY